jgi:hypothetical protein
MPAREILLAAVVPALLAASVAAQSARSSALGADIFWLHNREQNQQVSPLRYAGAGLGVALTYSTGTDVWRGGVHMAFASAELRSGISQNQEHVGSAKRLELSLPYERHAFAAGSRLAGVTLGAQLTGDLLYRNHTYSTNLSTEHFIDAFAWLAVSAGWQGAMGPGWRLRYHVALPLLGVVWRTPYTGAKYMPSAQLTLPNTLLAPESRIALTRPLSGALDLRASYELRLLRHEATWDLATASHRIGMGLDWHIRRPVPTSASRMKGDAR